MDGGPHRGLREGASLDCNTLSLAGARRMIAASGGSLKARCRVSVAYSQESKCRSPGEWMLAATTATRRDNRHRLKVANKAEGVKYAGAALRLHK
jgi:hypothetical protein